MTSLNKEAAVSTDMDVDYELIFEYIRDAEFTHLSARCCNPDCTGNCDECYEHYCRLWYVRNDKFALDVLSVKDRKDAFALMASLDNYLNQLSYKSANLLTRFIARRKLNNVFTSCIYLSDTSYSQGALYQLILQRILDKHLTLTKVFCI